MNHAIASSSVSLREKVVDYLSLERNVVIASGSSCSDLAKSYGRSIDFLLWKLAPEVPFVTAGIIGLLGTLVFAATVEERHAN